MTLDEAVAKLMTGNDETFTTLVLAVLKTRLRLQVSIKDEPTDFESSYRSFTCKVDLVLLQNPAPQDDADVGEADTVIATASDYFSVSK